MRGVTGMMQWESNMMFGAHTHTHTRGHTPYMRIRTYVLVTLLCITLIGVQVALHRYAAACAAEDARKMPDCAHGCALARRCGSIHSYPSMRACMHLESHQPWASLRYEWSRAACCKGPALYSEDHNAALSSWQVHLASKVATPSNWIEPKSFDIVGPKFQVQLRVSRCNDLWVDRLETLHGSGKHPDAKRAMQILGPLLS